LAPFLDLTASATTFAGGKSSTCPCAIYIAAQCLLCYWKIAAAMGRKNTAGTGICLS